MDIKQKTFNFPSTKNRNLSVGRPARFLFPMESVGEYSKKNHILNQIQSQGSLTFSHKPLINLLTETNIESQAFTTSHFLKEIRQRSLSRRNEPEFCRALKLPTVEANRNIKNKIKAYEEYHRIKSRKLVDLLKCKCSHNELKDQFLEIDAKINTLLATQKEMIEIPANYKDSIEIEAGLNYFYKLRARNNPLPIKIKISLIGKHSRGKLYLSSRISRPNEENYDKKWEFEKRDTIAIFFGRSDNERNFNEEFVYVTIYAERNLSLNFEHCFGKIALFSDFNSTKRREQFISKVPSKKMIEHIIQCLVEDESSFKTMCSNVRLIHQRRHKKCLSLGRNIDYVKQNKMKVQTMQNLFRPGEFDFRQNLVHKQKNMLEQQDLKQQFFKTYKWKINKYHNEILLKKKQSCENHKEIIQVWITVITLFKIFHFVNTQFEKLRELHRKREERFVAACRINFSISLNIRNISKKYKNRIKSRINSGVIGGKNKYYKIAEKRASEVLLEFCKFQEQISATLKVFSLFNKKIKKIQQTWRGILQFDSCRVNKIAILWDRKAENLVKSNCNGAKKQQTLARRVKQISERSKFMVLSQYYREAKLKFIKALYRYFNQKRLYETDNKASPQSILQNTGNDKFYITSIPTTHASSLGLFHQPNLIVHQKEKKRFSINNLEKVRANFLTNAPCFQYLPTEEQLLGLIILTAEKKLVSY